MKMNRKMLAAVAALVSTAAAAAAPKVVYRSVNLSRTEREKLELAARARSLRAEDYGRMLYMEGVADAAKGTLPRQLAAAPRLTPAATRADGVKVADGATIAFAGDYFMECGNEPGQFIGQILRGLEVAGVKGVKKSPAWSRAEKIEAMAERMKKLAAGKNDWIVFNGGANDGREGRPAEEVKKSLGAIFDAFAAAGKKAVVLTLWSPAGTAEWNGDVNDFIRAEAPKRGLLVADVAADAARDPLLNGFINPDLSDAVSRRVLAAMGVAAATADAVCAETASAPGTGRFNLALTPAQAEEADRVLQKTDPRAVILPRIPETPVRKDRYAVLCGIDDDIAVRTTCALSGKLHPKVLLFLTAGGDAPNQILRVKGTFIHAATRWELVKMWREEVKDVAALKEKILAADVIWFGSGVTERLQDRIAKYGLADTFRAAYEKGVVFGGYSAGAIMLCHAGFNDFEDGRYDLMPGLGFVKAYFGPHYHEPKWREFDARLAQEKEASLPSVAWALEDWTLVVYRNGEPDARQIQKTAKAFRFDRKDGNWTKQCVKGDAK